MKKSSMIGTDLMDEETFAFGFDTGSYQSLFDEGVPSLDFDGKHLSTGINWKNSADLDSPEDGLLELGFPKDGMSLALVHSYSYIYICIYLYL